MFLLLGVKLSGFFPKAGLPDGVRFGSDARLTVSETGRQAPEKVANNVNTNSANQTPSNTSVSNTSNWGAWRVEDVFEYATPSAEPKKSEGAPVKKDDVFHAQAVQEVIGGNRQAGLVHFQSELESDLQALTGYPETQFQTLLLAAQELQALGENQTAHQCLERAKKLAHGAGLSLDTQRGLALQSARNAKDAGNWVQAEGFYKGLLTHFTPGTLKGIEQAQVLGELGEVVWHLSRPAEAEQYFKEAVASVNSLADPASQADWPTQEALGEAVSRLYTLYLNTKRESEAEALKAQYAQCPVPIIPAGF